MTTNLDRIYQNKLSIYDLLVSKNKHKNSIKKENLKKQLSEKLADIGICHKAILQKCTKIDESILLNDKNPTENVSKERELNVVLTGKSVHEQSIEFQPINNKNFSDNFLLMKMTKSAEDIHSFPLESTRLSSEKKTLALITDLGTTQKYSLVKRKEKLVPISTLKPRKVANFVGSTAVKSVLKDDRFIKPKDQEILEVENSLLEESEKLYDILSNETLETRQRKRSKIRSVEEIISSLKSDDYIQSQIESDKRIDDLIKIVLERTNEEEEQEEVEGDSDHEGYETSFEPVTNVGPELLIEEKKSSPETDVEAILQELEENRDSVSGNTLAVEELEIDEERFESDVQIKESVVDQTETENFIAELQMDTNVTYEDMISVQGFQVHLKPCQNVPSIKGEAVKEQIFSLNTETHKGIHDLCLMPRSNTESSITLKHQWIEKYIPDKYPYLKENPTSTSIEVTKSERIEKAAERIINKVEEMEKWRLKALEMLKDEDIKIIGKYISPSFPKIHDIWHPSNPKLTMTPSRARKFLCPTYNKNFKEYSIEEISRQNTFENFSPLDYQSTEENSFSKDIDIEALETRERLISRRINSVEELTKEDQEIKNKNFTKNSKRTRSSSVPNRHWLEEDSLIIHLEYHQIMDEINIQKQLIRNLQNVSINVEPQITVYNSEKDEEKTEVKCVVSEESPLIYKETEIQEINVVEVDFISPAQKALLAGRNYIYYPPRRTKSSKKKNSKYIARISDIEAFLERQPKKLEKTSSFGNIIDELRNKKSKNKVRQSLNKSLCKSLTSIETFEDWSKKNGYNNDKNPRDWISTVWDLWFDEIYPPLPENLSDLVADKTISSQIVQNDSNKSKEVSTLSGNFNEILSLPEKIEPVLEEVEEEFRMEVVETLYDEIKNITMDLEKSNKPNAFLLSRRGAINRKLGFLAAAARDLNEAISIEPDLITTYWERHLLHLVCNKTQLAIEDLNLILKKDKNYVMAYKSRASIYASLGDMSLAISNLSQAIRLAPDDPDAYSKRAKLYEQNEDHRLALEDYNQLIRLQPNNCLAMMKHGLYYMNIEQWQLAVNDFSSVIKHYPLNTEAWLHRGTAFTKLCQWKDALIDFSSVIHLDPNNYTAFFKRGCLLRKAEPYMAIRDFSISLLLESSEENILSYLYRGILYATTKQYSEAIVDFEMVVCLNKDMCFAHVNLGLVYFELGDYEKAIKYMTSGLTADPTYIRAYACRAEAHFKLQKYEEAVKDINRAIHMYPDRSNYYMLRGDFYLAMNKMEMAAICVRQAAEISHNLGQSPVQQALVHSFLQRYDQAIDALMQATRNKPTITLLNLLGTTQMKAKRWKDAITSFSICLEQLKPKSQFKPWPPGAANLYFMVAQCYLELKNYKKSQQAFSATVKINPNHAEAYYHQGWCRLCLGKMKQGILDLNKALAINPKLYEAYLARATLFGFKNQFTKAILNCNEVLSIEPRSLRAYLYRGVLKYKIKAYSLAVKDFTEAIKIDPNCILAYFNRAICFNAEKQKYQKAIQDYSIVLLLNDALHIHYKAYINRGLVYLELDDISNALQDFIRAQTIEPNNISVLYVIGLCYHKLKNLSEAIRIFSRCLDNDSKFILAKVSRGNVFMDYNTNQGRDLAAKDYISVLKFNPNHLDALINLGFCRQAQGKFKQAWDIFTEAIGKHPKSEKPLDGRAIVCMQMKDLNGALKDLNEAIRIQPQSAVLYVNRGVVHQLMRDGIRAMKDYSKATLICGYQHEVAYYNMGCIYLHNFQLDQASKCFMKALEINETDEAVWINLALIHVFRNKLEESLEYINKSISLAPRAAYLYFNRAIVLFSLKNYKEAEEDFSTSLKLVPDNPHVHKARADCRSKLGDTAGALQDYKLSVYISSTLKRTRL